MSDLGAADEERWERKINEAVDHLLEGHTFTVLAGTALMMQTLGRPTMEVKTDLVLALCFLAEQAMIEIEDSPSFGPVSENPANGPSS